MTQETLSGLCWIKGQAESAMALASQSDGAEQDLALLASFASDIAINAEMLIWKIEQNQ